MTQLPQSLCIVGFGRLGQTLAKILTPHFTLAVLDTSPAQRKKAHAAGYTLITPQAIASYATVIFCVPISHFEPALRQLSKHFAPGTLVMDTCSVKVFPAKVMKRVLPQNIASIATHPLFGPDSVGQGLQTLSIVTCPVRSRRAQYETWNSFWRKLGLQVIETTPEQHDKITARTLVLPHLLGRALRELQLQPQQITTWGYNALYDVMQRTTNDTWQLFRDMQRYNPYAKTIRKRLQRALQTIEANLEPDG